MDKQKKELANIIMNYICDDFEVPYNLLKDKDSRKEIIYVIKYTTVHNLHYKNAMF